MGLTKVRYKALKGGMNLYNADGSILSIIEKGDILEFEEIIKVDHPRSKQIARLSNGCFVVYEYNSEIFYEPIKKGKK